MGVSSSHDMNKYAVDCVKDMKKGAKRLSVVMREHALTREQRHALFEKRDNYGRTLLLLACVKGNVRIAKLLVEEGADVKARSDNGCTALHFASRQTHEEAATELVSVLMAANCDPVVRDDKLQFPIQTAQLSGKLRVLRNLEYKVSDFCGLIKVETFSLFQSMTGKVVGTAACARLSKTFGSEWKPRWVVVTRLMGSHTMAPFSQMRCPRCMAFQVTLTKDVSTVHCQCGQLLTVPPRQRSVCNLLTIYRNANHLVPDTVLDLTGATVPAITHASGVSIVKVVFSKEAFKKVDPAYRHNHNVVEGFHQVRKRIVVSGEYVVRFLTPNRSLAGMLHTVLSKKVCTWPEPGIPSNINGCASAITTTTLHDVQYDIQASELGNVGSSSSRRLPPHLPPLSLPPVECIVADNIPLAIPVSDNEPTPSLRIPRSPSFIEGGRASASAVGATADGAAASLADSAFTPSNSADLSREWSCAACTFENAHTWLSCEVCGNPKPTVDNCLDHCTDSVASAPSMSTATSPMSPRAGQCSRLITSGISPPGSPRAGQCSHFITSGASPPGSPRAEQCSQSVTNGPPPVSPRGCTPPPAYRTLSPIARGALTPVLPPRPRNRDPNSSQASAHPTASEQPRVHENLTDSERATSAAVTIGPEPLDIFLCPLTHEIFVDPVLTCDGQTYDRRAIQDWFDADMNTSPVTGTLLDNKNLVPNIALRRAIDDHVSFCS